VSVLSMGDLSYMRSPTDPGAPPGKEFKVAVIRVITALPSVASFCQPATMGESAAGFFAIKELSLATSAFKALVTFDDR
jgi:hypothetical protein